PNYLCRFTVRAVYSLPAAFLGSVNQQLRLLNFSSPSQLTVTQGGFAYPDHSLLGHALPSACLTILLRHHFTRTIYTGTGISACRPSPTRDRKSTRLNSSHVSISYAVFCLKKKNKKVNMSNVDISQ